MAQSDPHGAHCRGQHDRSGFEAAISHQPVCEGQGHLPREGERQVLHPPREGLATQRPACCLFIANQDGNKIIFVTQCAALLSMPCWLCSANPPTCLLLLAGVKVARARIPIFIQCFSHAKHTGGSLQNAEKQVRAVPRKGMFVAC